jgi:hypothetical protein
MTTFQQREAKPQHCGMILKRLRHEHHQALAKLGRNAHQELRRIFDDSTYRRTWFHGERIAGIAGVTGPLAAPYGYVWMALAEETTRRPTAIIRCALDYLDEVMVVKRELATTIIGGDEAAKRLAVFLGFHVEDNGPGAPAFTRVGRRSLSRHLDSTPDLRLPVGEGFIIGMGYHDPRSADLP